jgi:thiamine-monophosphate kinase
VGERGWLRRVRRWMTDANAAGAAAAAANDLALGIGDDAALLRPGAPGSLLAVTTDALIEGVHFRRDWISPGDLGRKALAVNLSDLAAMGARPVAAFLALGVPPTTPLADLRAFFMGLRAEGRRWGCPLAGGDMVRARCWTIAVTVIGRTPAPVPDASIRDVSAPGVGAAGDPGGLLGSPPFRRDGAQPGDWLYVTGRPGRAGGGLEAIRRGLDFPALARAHRRPTPRLAEAGRLAALGCVAAAMDLSDGLWDDASKLAEASGVAIELWLDALPRDAGLERLGRFLKRDPLDWTLFGGEDYELLFVMRRPLALAQEWPKAFEGRPLAPARQIGRIVRIVAGRGVVRLLETSGGPTIPVRDRSWAHF